MLDNLLNLDLSIPGVMPDMDKTMMEDFMTDRCGNTDYVNGGLCHAGMDYTDLDGVDHDTP